MGQRITGAPMWLTQFEIKYEEFHLEFVEIVYYKLLVQNLASNMLGDMKRWEPKFDAFQIPGTNLQQECQSWFNGRQFRITASICKTVTRLGGNLGSSSLHSWLRKKFWFKEKITTFYMQYGIGEEPYAIQAYTKVVI